VVNIAFAFTIGLLILNVFRPGLAWQERLAAHLKKEATAETAVAGKTPTLDEAAKKVSL